MDNNGEKGISATLPGSLATDFADMGQPYGIYVNPYTGYIYGTDAASFESMGYLYQWTPEGELKGKHKVYVNPGHFLALPPNGSGIEGIAEENGTTTVSYYDIEGRRITPPFKKGQLYKISK
jgi:hypothetical protein